MPSLQCSKGKNQASSWQKRHLKNTKKSQLSLLMCHLKKTIEVSHAQNIYAYDAYLIQCAQQTSTSLLTLDNQLKITAEKMGVNILELK